MIRELLASTIESKESQLAKNSKIYTLGKWQKLNLSDKFKRDGVV